MLLIHSFLPTLLTTRLHCVHCTGISSLDRLIKIIRRLQSLVPFLKNIPLKAYRYSVAISIANHIVPPVQTLKPEHSVRLLRFRNPSVTQETFAQELLFCVKDSLQVASPNTTILIYSSQFTANGIYFHILYLEELSSLVQSEHHCKKYIINILEVIFYREWFSSFVLAEFYYKEQAIHSCKINI